MQIDVNKLFEEKDALYTIFISPDTHEDYQQVITEYQNSRENDFIWICPVKKDGGQDVLEALLSKTVLIKEQENE